MVEIANGEARWQKPVRGIAGRVYACVLGGGLAARSNKGMKLTKPVQTSELRSLSPVLDRPFVVQRVWL